MAHLASVNLGVPRPNPYKKSQSTGIGKQSVEGPVEVRAPGPKTTGLGSGLVGDFIGDDQHHGGDNQAVYAVQREDLDLWQDRLGRELPDGFFGENLTTVGLEANQALIGERWQIGDSVVMQVRGPRIPCSTFRGWVDEKAWLKTFTAAERPGAYLSIVSPGLVQRGDTVEVLDRPAHDVTVSMLFRALTTDRRLLSRLEGAEAYLDDDVREMLGAR